MLPMNTELEAQPLVHKAPFHEIYVESRAKTYLLTQKILEKFKKSKITEIHHYKAVFNQKNQDFQRQKSHYSLILAVKEDEFLYPGSDFAPRFGHPHFYYNSLVMNCVYNCEYCYLQGMYPSAHIVVFVNQEDFMDAVINQMDPVQGMYLSVSYDTDLLALENLLGMSHDWHLLAKKYPQLKIELRTKSSPVGFIKGHDPLENFILAFTLSPDVLIQKYEHLSSRFERRLEAIELALKQGWSVRLCFDPLLWVQGHEKLYLEMILKIKERIPLAKVHSLSLGSFRISHRFYQKIKKIQSTSPVIQFPFEKTAEEVRYQKYMQEKLMQPFRDHLKVFFKDEQWSES